MAFSELVTFGIRLVARNEMSAELNKIADEFKVLNWVTRNGIRQAAETVKDQGTAGAMAAGMFPQALREITRYGQVAVDTLGNLTQDMIDNAAKVQSTMTQVGVILGMDRKEVDKLTTSLIQFTAGLPASAQEVADATLEFAKMGMIANKTNEEIMNMSLQSIMFARSIGTSNAAAAEWLGKLHTWLGIANPTAQSMAEVGSVVTQLGWQIKGTSIDVMKATERFGAFWSAMGASNVEVLALGALISDSGILLRRGSTGVNRAGQLLASNARAFGVQLQKRGMIGSVNEFVSEFRTKPVEAFVRVLRMLNQAHGVDASNMLRAAGLHGNYVSDIITMSRNVEKYTSMVIEGEAARKRAAEGAGDTMKMFQKMNETYVQTLKSLDSTIQGMKTLAGGPLIAVMTEVMSAITMALAAITKSKFSWIIPVIGAFMGLLYVITYVTVALVGAKLAMYALGKAGFTALAAWLPILGWIIAGVIVLAAVIIGLAYAWKRLKGEETSWVAATKDVAAGMKGISDTMQEAAMGGVPGVATTEGGEIAAAGGEVELPGAPAGKVVSRKSLLWAGEKQPEIVMPLTHLATMMGGFASKVASMVGGGAGGAAAPVNVSLQAPIYLDGAQIATAVAERKSIDSIRSGGQA